MENPWLDLDTTNNKFVAKCDISYINNYVRNGKKKIRLDFIPHPYMGNPFTAVVYLLLGNPNIFNDDSYNKIESNIYIENLQHKINDYPLYWLNPIYKESKCYKWWIDRLRYLDGGTDRKIVTNRVFEVEYYAYYSNKFHNTIKLPSQEYSFHLIKQAISDGKIIIIARNKESWYSAIPALRNYINKYELKNPRNVIISPNNIIGQDNFDKIIKKLKFG